MTVILVYVDDIVVTGDDETSIRELFTLLHLHIQDLGKLKYFLGIEVARSSKGIFLSQRKYTLDILAETGMIGGRSVTFPIEQNLKFTAYDGQLLEDPGRYRRIVGKLIYLTITRPDIAFAVVK